MRNFASIKYQVDSDIFTKFSVNNNPAQTVWLLNSIQENYLKYYQPLIQFFDSSSLFSTGKTKINNNWVITKKQLIFGPYKPFEKGFYKATFNFLKKSKDIEFFVHSHKLNINFLQVLVHKKVKSYTLYFKLPQKVEDLELITHNTSSTPVYFNNVIIEKIPEDQFKVTPAVEYRLRSKIKAFVKKILKSVLRIGK